MVRVFASLIQKYVRKDLRTTKGAIRTRKSKKLQYNTSDQMKNDKRTNNDLQNIAQKTKHRATDPH